MAPGPGAHAHAPMLAATTSSLFAGASPRDLAIEAVLAIVFGWLGWRVSRAFAAQRGVTPWRLPSFVWGLICFFFMVLGLILELVAQLTTRTPVSSPSREGAGPPFAHTDGASAALPVPGVHVGAGRPGPAPAAASDEVAQAPPEPRLPAPPPGRDGSTALFGWYADVTARHELRYWDGRGWTDLVRDGGVGSLDPL